MAVFGDHLSGQQVYFVSEMTVDRIVYPKHTRHACMFEISQVEIGYPHVLLHKVCKGNSIKFKHFEIGFQGDFAVELSVYIKICICVLFGEYLFFCLYHVVFTFVCFASGESA